MVRVGLCLSVSRRSRISWPAAEPAAQRVEARRGGDASGQLPLASPMAWVRTRPTRSSIIAALMRKRNFIHWPVQRVHLADLEDKGHHRRVVVVVEGPEGLPRYLAAIEIFREEQQLLALEARGLIQPPVDPAASRSSPS